MTLGIYVSISWLPTRPNVSHSANLSALFLKQAKELSLVTLVTTKMNMSPGQVGTLVGLLEGCPLHKRVASLIPSQDTDLGCRLDP